MQRQVVDVSHMKQICDKDGRLSWRERWAALWYGRCRLRLYLNQIEDADKSGVDMVIDLRFGVDV